MSVRPATQADEAAVLRLIQELFEPPGAKPRGYTPERGRAGFRAAIDSPNADVLVADDSGEIVGLASVYLDLPFIRYGKRCWLQDLVVTSSRRGGGVGKLLVDAATDWARERGCSHLELSSGAGRVDAHRFYRREGMAENRVFGRQIEG